MPPIAKELSTYPTFRKTTHVAGAVA